MRCKRKKVRVIFAAMISIQGHAALVLRCTEGISACLIAHVISLFRSVVLGPTPDDARSNVIELSPFAINAQPQRQNASMLKDVKE